MTRASWVRGYRGLGPPLCTGLRLVDRCVRLSELLSHGPTDRLALHATMAIMFMRRLLPTSDGPLVQDLIGADPSYTQRIGGKSPGPGDGLALLTTTPLLYQEDDKHVLGLFDGDSLVAVADIIRGYPTEDYAFIGLLQVRSDRKGQGLGRLMHDQVLGYVSSQMPNVTRMRLGIVATNRAEAEPFWLQMGYEATGETKCWNQGPITSTTLLYERGVAYRV